MSEIYVCFNDSVADPTYSSAQNSFLVVPNSNSYEDVNGNPCTERNLYRKVPVLPGNLEELREFCAIMDWGLDFNEHGEAVINS